MVSNISTIDVRILKTCLLYNFNLLLEKKKKQERKKKKDSIFGQHEEVLL